MAAARRRRALRYVAEWVGTKLRWGPRLRRSRAGCPAACGHRLPRQDSDVRTGLIAPPRPCRLGPRGRFASQKRVHLRSSVGLGSVAAPGDPYITVCVDWRCCAAGEGPGAAHAAGLALSPVGSARSLRCGFRCQGRSRAFVTSSRAYVASSRPGRKRMRYIIGATTRSITRSVSGTASPRRVARLRMASICSAA